MKLSFDTETITSRKWIIINTLIPTIITDAILVIFNELAWFFWGKYTVYSDSDFEELNQMIPKLDKLNPHVAVISAAVIILFSILIFYILFALLLKTNRVNNKIAFKHYTIIILIKALLISCMMYVLWYKNPVSLSDWNHWIETVNIIGFQKTIALLLFYIPIIVFICRNKDKT